MAAGTTARSLTKRRGWEEEEPASPFPLEGRGGEGVSQQEEEEEEARVFGGVGVLARARLDLEAAFLG